MNKQLLMLCCCVFLIVGCRYQPQSLPSSPTPNQVTDNPSDELALWYHPISLPALHEKEYNGDQFTIVKTLDDTNIYTRYQISYTSESITISGILNIPKGDGPFPLIVTNHGYIDPAVYTNGRGLKREQDYLARAGYAVLHPDYRNHAFSDTDEQDYLSMRLGYTTDVINAIYAIKQTDVVPTIDSSRIGMLGHSMGGGITLNILTSKPELVQATVLFAPVSSVYKDNFEEWTAGSLEGELILEQYGNWDTDASFWNNISARTFFDHIASPIQIHHGTADESVPLAWSIETYNALQNQNKDAVLYTYDNEPHEFINAWPLVMKRTVDFFDSHLK